MVNDNLMCGELGEFIMLGEGISEGKTLKSEKELEFWEEIGKEWEKSLAECSCLKTIAVQKNE